jgi:hypothetical protein
MDTGMDIAMDAGEAGRWLTYDELAKARGIDKQSAVKLVLRRQWRRQKDNRGTVRAYVPVDEVEAQRPSRDRSIDTSTDTSVAMSTDMSMDNKALADALAAFAKEIEAAREERAGLLADLRAERVRADGQAARADEAQNRADAEVAARQEADARATTAESRADAAEALVADQAARLDAMQSDADARAAWSRWRRLRWAIGRR